jgi:hypothetical protein
MITDLITALALFILANLVTYGIVNGLGITEIPPGYLSILVQIAIALILYLFGVTIPYFAEIILAELIVVSTNKVLQYLTGATF